VGLPLSMPLSPRLDLRVESLIASVQAADPNTPVDAIKTAAPINHVIIIVGENRSFNHLFATCVPADDGGGG